MHVLVSVIFFFISTPFFPAAVFADEGLVCTSNQYIRGGQSQRAYRGVVIQFPRDYGPESSSGWMRIYDMSYAPTLRRLTYLREGVAGSGDARQGSWVSVWRSEVTSCEARVYAAGESRSDDPYARVAVHYKCHRDENRFTDCRYCLNVDNVNCRIGAEGSPCVRDDDCQTSYCYRYSDGGEFPIDVGACGKRYVGQSCPGDDDYCYSHNCSSSSRYSGPVYQNGRRTGRYMGECKATRLSRDPPPY